MNNKELNRILSIIQSIPNSDERDEATGIVLRAASESLNLKKLKSMVKSDERLGTNGASNYIKFTKKEIEQMPEKLQRVFILEDKIVPYRRTANGHYQARYRRKGYNIEIVGADFDSMKKKFIEKLCRVEEEKINNNFPTFEEFVNDWMRVKKHTLKESTYAGYLGMMQRNLLPEFGKMRLNQMTRIIVQNYLFALADEGKNRTAEKLKTLLSAIFRVAVEDYPTLPNPISRIVLNPYDVKKGRAFTKKEESELVQYCLSKLTIKPHANCLLVLLYTGMRVGELSSMTYDDTYIYCESEKIRKGKAKVIRKIPISPMLRKILPLIDLEKAKDNDNSKIRYVLKKIFPDRHIHEMRYTFITRAKECGCNPELVMTWTGHESDQDVKVSRVDRGYTTFSDEYSQSEMLKYDYEL